MNNTPPRHITLATDLSARSDRAYDRLRQLAEEWKARVLAVHAVEAHQYEFWDGGPSWRRSPDMVDVARRQLLEYPGWPALNGQIISERGDPYEVVSKNAEAFDTDLIVTGVARDEVYGASVLGRLVTELCRTANVPILSVKRRASAAYGRIVVASDLSASSADALLFALRSFPGRAITLFHAFGVPYPNLVDDLGAVRRTIEQEVTREGQQWLEKYVGAEGLKVSIVADYGEPASLLAKYVIDKDVELVVTGSHGRSAMSELFIGSVARGILERVTCDVCVVRPAAARRRS